MTTQQTLILDAIQERCKATLTIDYGYANTGVIRAIDPETMLAVRSLEFDFQERSAKFVIPQLRAHPFACHYYGKPRREGQIDAVKSTPMEMIDAVINYLEGR